MFAQLKIMHGNWAGIISGVALIVHAAVAYYQGNSSDATQSFIAGWAALGLSQAVAAQKPPLPPAPPAAA